MNKPSFFYPHDADPDIFREALANSEAATGFTATLIEKNCYCSLILQYLFGSDTSLVFKVGTCLSKIYADFYRLSEDPDFVIPVYSDASRRQRRDEIEPVKQRVDEIPNAVPGLVVSEIFRGHNESRQYIGQLEYRSAVIEKTNGSSLRSACVNHSSVHRIPCGAHQSHKFDPDISRLIT